jgi:hypothetical protein
MCLEEGAPELVAGADQCIQSVPEIQFSTVNRDRMNHVEHRPERIIPANEGCGNDRIIAGVINM